MSKKAKKGALYDKEIQQLLDDGFLSSGDDEIEDEEFNDSDVSSGDDIDDENWTVPFEISESSSESETDDDLEDGDRSNSQANVSNIPITNAQNDSSVAGTSASNDNSNTAGNDPNATGKNNSDPPINLDDWHTLILKPTLLKFRGEEKVLLDNLSTQPTTPVEFFRLFFDNVFLDKIIGFSNEEVRLLTRFKPLNRRSPLRNFKPFQETTY
ncbi:uncharacterized protein LOC135849897 [Planococcus citri]|uniref:uncharacterized protein LOC135849897 n=1 Tax=Planococcus citri TaxID=170843 RepID=UPI0031F9EA39